MGMTNHAALGYAIFAAKFVGFEDFIIQDLVDNMRLAFDSQTEDEAVDVFSRSPY